MAKLGEGIAKVSEVNRFPQKIRRAYSPGGEDAMRLLRSLGATDIGEVQAETKHLVISELALSSYGYIYTKEEDGSVHSILGPLDILNVKEALSFDPEFKGLNEFADTHTDQRIFIRTLKEDGRPVMHQIWIPRDPMNTTDTQVLVDALYCLVTHYPAEDESGHKLSDEGIEEVARRVGITFDMSLDGEVLLPEIHDSL